MFDPSYFSLSICLSVDNFLQTGKALKIYVSKLVTGRRREMSLSFKFEFRHPRRGRICWPWAFCVVLLCRRLVEEREEGEDSLNISGGIKNRGIWEPYYPWWIRLGKFHVFDFEGKAELLQHDKKELAMWLTSWLAVAVGISCEPNIRLQISPQTEVD